MCDDQHKFGRAGGVPAEEARQIRMECVRIALQRAGDKEGIDILGVAEDIANFVFGMVSLKPTERPDEKKHLVDTKIVMVDSLSVYGNSIPLDQLMSFLELQQSRIRPTRYKSARVRFIMDTDFSSDYPGASLESIEVTYDDEAGS